MCQKQFRSHLLAIKLNDDLRQDKPKLNVDKDVKNKKNDVTIFIYGFQLRIDDNKKNSFEFAIDKKLTFDKSTNNK